MTSVLAGRANYTSGPSALNVKQFVFLPTSLEDTILAAKDFAFSSSLAITNELATSLAMLE